MKEGNLPSDIAQEPSEEARLSQDSVASSQTMDSSKKRKGITFAEATQSTRNSPSQSSSVYKEALSQPAPGMTHKQRLLWLQRRREAGLWVQCDDCNRWRFLANVLDSHELPAKWTCRMNPDKSVSDCSIPETPMSLRDEEDLIHSEYSAGSIVWARLTGWPWWPAMVDDCPDTEQYYWLDGFSDIPTHYNVVFFDATDVTRAWIASEQLRPFESNKKFFSKFAKDKRYKKRMEAAINQAEKAIKLPLAERLSQYSFIARYPGSINKPKEISKNDMIKFQKKLKRKYNVVFPLDEDSSDDDVIALPQREETTVIKTRENVLLVGTPKGSKKRADTTKKVVEEIVPKNDMQEKIFKDSLLGETEEVDSNTVKNTDTDTFKEPNSMSVQVVSTVTSTVIDASLDMDDDTSKTYLPDSEKEKNIQEDESDSEIIRVRVVTPSSDDFEF